MKIFFCLLFVSFTALANVQMDLYVLNDQPKQGEILSARLVIKEARGQTALTGLKGKNFQKTLYLLSLSPFVVKSGYLESDAKVIFLKVPESNSAKETINGQDVLINWGEINLVATEAAESFLLGEFDIPKKMRLFLWFAVGLLVLVLSAVSYRIFLKIKMKKVLLKRKKELRSEMLNCQTYEDVVLMWKNKLRYLSTFPHLENSFKNLEKVLFKYQFKPFQTSDEKSEVMRAFEQFKADVSGRADGV